MRSTQVTTLSTDSIDQFRNWLSDRGLSAHTAKSYASDLQQLLLAAGTSSIPILELEELAEGPLEADDPGPLMITIPGLEEVGMHWLTAHRAELAPRTTQRRLTSLRTFARFAGQGQLFLEYKAPTALKHIPDPLPEGIEGVYRLIDAATDWRIKTLVGLCGLAGARISEALSQKPDRVDFQNSMVYIRGKGDKERPVPFDANGRLAEILMEAVIRSHGEPVIVRMGDRLARRTITRLGKRAKLKREIASHQLRATFATHLHDEGVNIRTIQELLGHANVTTTEGYTAVTLNRMRKAVKGL